MFQEASVDGLADLNLAGLEIADIPVVCAWLIAAGIVFFSLGPESIRPHLFEPEFERFVSYFVLGLATILAYPDQPVIVAISVVGAAVLLESLQYVLPHRHAHLPDSRDGAMGGFLGVVLGGAAVRLFFLENGPKVVTDLLKRIG